MLRHIRRLAGIVALLALSLSFAEAAGAAVCPQAAPASSHAQHQGQSPDQTGCPMHLAGLPCSIAIPLPTAPVFATTCAPSSTVATPAPPSCDDLLIIVSIFHPPRS